MKANEIPEKTVTLLALVTAYRLQTLALITIDNITVTSSKVQFRIPDLIETSKPESFQPNLIPPFHKERPNICAAQALIDYSEYTEDKRGNNKNLFISVRKPYNSVGSQTISHWIKSMLKKSGVDINVFTACTHLFHQRLKAALI